MSNMPGLVADDARAPVFAIPQQRIVGIEHPCIIKNFENGIKSLGGEPQIKHILEHAVGDSLKNPEKPLEEPQAGVSLRPQDPYAKKLESTGIDTRNVLVKVTLPKRTGRKRKRGSDDPFTSSGESSQPNDSMTVPQLLARLRDNPDSYKFEPIGTLNETHRFRSLPDFQLSARTHPMMRELGLHTFPPSHAAISNFRVPLTPGAAHIHAFPAPPSFTSTPQPHLYQYTQAPGVKITQNPSGTATVTNYAAPPRRLVRPIDPDIPAVPTGPPPELKKYNPFGTYLDAAIKALAALLNERPLVTRRVAMNAIPHFSDTVFKEATQWVGYSFRAGPFRDSLIKYGVDPRSDPKYRFYQTLMFQLDRVVAGAPEAKLPGSSTSRVQSRWNRGVRHVPDGWQSHVFDGEHVTLNGKTWQIIDVTDPLLARLFATADLPAVCDTHHFGWYHNGTLCKARAIMRDKMECLFAGAEPPLAVYEYVAKFPEVITQERLASLYVDKDMEGVAKAQALAMEVRNMARLGRRMLLEKDAEKRAREARERGEDVLGNDGDEVVDAEDAEAGAIDPALAQPGDEDMAGDFDDDEGVGEGNGNDDGREDGNDAEADLQGTVDLQENDLVG